MILKICHGAKSDISEFLKNLSSFIIFVYLLFKIVFSKVVVIILMNKKSVVLKYSLEICYGAKGKNSEFLGNISYYFITFHYSLFKKRIFKRLYVSY